MFQSLQPLSGEFLNYKTANVADDARFDVNCFGVTTDGRLTLTLK